MVEREAIADARPAIMAGEAETLVPSSRISATMSAAITRFE